MIWFKDKLVVDISKMRGQHKVHFLSQKETITSMLRQGYSQKAVWTELSHRYDWQMTYSTFGYYVQKYSLSQDETENHLNLPF